jgi:hypothetical protein
MSAMPSMATEFVRRNEPTRWATSGCEQSQQTTPLFDHLVGAGEKRTRKRDTEFRSGLEIKRQLKL